MATMFDNPALTRGIVIAASGVAIGLLLSVGYGIGRLVRKRKRDAVAVTKEELIPAMAMAFAPITKVLYAFVAASVLSQRNLADAELSIVAIFAGGAFALIAVVQGGWAANLINAPKGKESLLGTALSILFKMAMLGAIETFAVFVLIGTIIFAPRLLPVVVAGRAGVGKCVDPMLRHVAVIGGPDGPTAIWMTSSWWDLVMPLRLAIVLGLVVLGILLAAVALVPRHALARRSPKDNGR